MKQKSSNHKQSLFHLLLHLQCKQCISSVNFSSRWYLCGRKKPFSLHLVSQKFLQRCPWNSSNALVIYNGPLSLLNTSDLPRSKPLVRVALPASLSALSFPFTQACPGQCTHRSFWRWMATIDTFHTRFPIPFFTVCSKPNLWGWWHVWSDTHLVRQSSGGLGLLLPPPLSSWRLRPYRLQCLPGW